MGTTLRVLLTAAVLAAPVCANPIPGTVADPDMGLRMALGSSRDALNAAFTDKSPFWGQVQGAYEGYEDGADMAPMYISRGKELRETLGIVASQLEAARGQLPGTAAAIRRRAQEAREMVQLYLVLPRDVAGVDAKEGGAEELRSLFVQGMTKIAQDGDYAAAAAFRIRAVELSRRQPPRR
jgi:hypothetical protein